MHGYIFSNVVCLKNLFVSSSTTECIFLNYQTNSQYSLTHQLVHGNFSLDKRTRTILDIDFYQHDSIYVYQIN